jgi:hypothetical protein
MAGDLREVRVGEVEALWLAVQTIEGHRERLEIPT